MGSSQTRETFNVGNPGSGNERQMRSVGAGGGGGMYQSQGGDLFGGYVNPVHGQVQEFGHPYGGGQYVMANSGSGKLSTNRVMPCTGPIQPSYGPPPVGHGQSKLAGVGWEGVTPGFGDPLKIDMGWEFPILEQAHLPRVNPFAQIPHGVRTGLWRPVRQGMLDIRGKTGVELSMEKAGNMGHPARFESLFESRFHGADQDDLAMDTVAGDHGHYGV
jgi:hypothetical protein